MSTTCSRSVLVLERDQVGERRGRTLHQRDTHLGDDAQVGLGEHAIRERAEPVLEQLPGIAPGDRAHTGPHDLALGKHDLQAGLPHEVVPVRRVADAAVQRVADDASPAEVGAVEHEGAVGVFQVFSQVEIRDARLQEGVAVPLVDLEDLVHLRAGVDHDGACEPRRRAAVAVVLSCRHRGERHPVLVGGPDDRLDFFDASGRDHRRRASRQVRSDGIRVGVLGQLGLVGDHPLLADDLGERRQCSLEGLFTYSGR